VCISISCLVGARFRAQGNYSIRQLENQRIREFVEVVHSAHSSWLTAHRAKAQGNSSIRELEN
jgi:hypothetical protein